PGEGTRPVFSPDSARVAAFISTIEPKVRGSDRYFEEVQDEYSDERVIVDWATPYVQQVRQTAVDAVAVGVELPGSSDLELAREWNTYHAVRFASNDA